MHVCSFVKQFTFKLVTTQPDGSSFYFGCFAPKIERTPIQLFLGLSSTLNCFVINLIPGAPDAAATA
jgi:hypothetical protein